MCAHLQRAPVQTRASKAARDRVSASLHIKCTTAPASQGQRWLLLGIRSTGHNLPSPNPSCQLHFSCGCSAPAAAVSGGAESAVGTDLRRQPGWWWAGMGLGGKQGSWDGTALEQSRSGEYEKNIKDTGGGGLRWRLGLKNTEMKEQQRNICSSWSIKRGD